MFTDETFNINESLINNDYILDECCNGRAYRLIYNPSKNIK